MEGEDAPSIVELELDRIASGTRLRVRETRSTRACWSTRSIGVRLPARAPDRIFAALSDPTRCRIVERLGRSPATAGEIAAQLPVTRQAS